MPLYELISITRCGDAKSTANFFRQVAIGICEAGGNVRDLKVLGDRILSRQTKGNDSKNHLVGRYCQVIFDGNLDVKRRAEVVASDSYEMIHCQTHRLKDFFNDATMFKKAYNMRSPVIDESARKRKFVMELLNLKEQQKQ